MSEKLPVYVATTDAQKAQGLMGMRTLPQGIGMAFEWNQPTTGGFWMKDTLISLSVAFVDQHHRIVSIQRMTPCTADPCQVYVSPVPYELAVEANPNWFTARLIEVGEYAHLETGRAHA